MTNTKQRPFYQNQTLCFQNLLTKIKILFTKIKIKIFVSKIF